MQTRHDPDVGEWLSIGAAAKALGISTDTLRRWSDAGHITAQQPIPGGHRRFRRADVDALIKRSQSSTAQASA